MRLRTLFLLVPVLAALGVTVALPQAQVLIDSFRDAAGFTLRHWERFADLERPANLLATWNSAWLSVASVVLAALIGVPLALLVARVDFPGRSTLAALAILPLLLPPIVGVLTFDQFLFGEYGLVPRALERWFGLRWYLDGFAGILALHAYAFFPLFYLFVAAAQKRLDPSLPEAARSLGASRLATLARVTLPLLMPALAGAAVLVLLNAMGSFSAPLFFAPDAEILTLRIANLREEDPALVAVLATVLAVAALALLLPLRRLEAATDVRSASKGSAPLAAAPGGFAGRALLGAGTAIFLLLLLLPHLAIILLSFSPDQIDADRLLPRALTLAHYERIFSDDAFLRTLRNSTSMAGIAAALDLVLGLGIATLLLRRHLPGRRTLELLAFLPLALPATVIAFNLLKTFSRPWPFTADTVLAGTWLLLPFAWFVRHLPIAVRAIQSALATLDPTLVDAATGLGASRAATFRRVVLPLVLPGVLSGALLCFLTALSEFPAAILLYVPDNVPITVEIFNRRYNRALGEPAALSVLLLLAQAALLLIANRFLRVERAAR